MNNRIKKLMEQRAELIEKMGEMTDNIEVENRAFTEEENADFDALESKVKAIDATVESLKRAQALACTEKDEINPERRTKEETEEAETRAFAAYIRGEVSERADNLTKSANGAVIPSSIVNKIIDKVKDSCPIYAMATVYNVGGTINIPYVDTSADEITVAYANEFSALTGHANKFASIQLTGYLAGALSLISKSLLNNSDFDLVNFVINKMGEKLAEFIEGELIHGTSGKADGMAKGITQTITAKSATAVTADELIDLQESIPDVYQAGACWIMNKATRTAIRKLKDNDNDYLLNRDMSAQWGYTLLGKPVYVTDKVDAMASGKDAIFYGDFSGLAVKMSESASIEVLYEAYATQHAVGVVGWIELDAKVENAQKLAKLTMKSGT